MRGTVAGLIAWLVLMAPARAAGPASEAVTLEGTAILLTEALRAKALAVDSEPIALQVVIKAADGTITPLFSDDASRALFKDERLRGRRAEIKGLRRPGLPYIQVLGFRIEQDGRLRTPEYYCEICSISVRYPQICPCCQGEMVLRMKPEPH